MTKTNQISKQKSDIKQKKGNYSFLIFNFSLILTILFFSACQPSSTKNTKVYDNPLDVLTKKMEAENANKYSVILEDMDYRENSADPYAHKYKIIKIDSVEQTVADSTFYKDTAIVSSTAWTPVNESYFKENEQNLGMEVLSKQNDSISRFVSPPGYSHYVNNPKYGEWRENESGVKIWHFFAGYMIYRTLFGYNSFPVRQSYYNNYSNNRSAGKSYYGNNMYGSKGSYTKGMGNGTSWSSSSTKYANRKSTTTKTKRNSTRYNSKTSKTRSSGGFGK